MPNIVVFLPERSGRMSFGVDVRLRQELRIFAQENQFYNKRTKGYYPSMSKVIVGFLKTHVVKDPRMDWIESIKATALKNKTNLGKFQRLIIEESLDRYPFVLDANDISGDQASDLFWGSHGEYLNGFYLFTEKEKDEVISKSIAIPSQFISAEEGRKRRIEKIEELTRRVAEKSESCSQG